MFAFHTKHTKISLSTGKFSAQNNIFSSQPIFVNSLMPCDKFNIPSHRIKHFISSIRRKKIECQKYREEAQKLKKEKRKLTKEKQRLYDEASRLEKQLSSKTQTVSKKEKGISLQISTSEKCGPYPLQALREAAANYIQQGVKKSGCEKSRPVDVLQRLFQTDANEISKDELNIKTVAHPTAKDSYFPQNTEKIPIQNLPAEKHHLSEFFQEKFKAILSAIQTLISETENYLSKISQLEKEILSLENENERMQYKVSSLEERLQQKFKAACKKSESIFIPITFEEYFKNESLLTLLMVAKESMKYSPDEKKRSGDILKSLTQTYAREIDEYESHRNTILRASRNDNWKIANNALKFFGMRRTQANNGHYRIDFIQDESYRVAQAATRSDRRGAQNEETEIAHVFFI